MTRSPFANALLALLYIVIVASIMFFGVARHPGPDNSILIPIAMLSLLTLSAAVMACLFFYQPAQLYFEGKKKQGVDLFLKTVGIFAGVTALLFALFLSGVLR